MRLHPCLPLSCLLALLLASPASGAEDPPESEGAAEAVESIERSQLPSRSSLQEAALRRTLDQQQLRQLQAGEDEFIGLFLPAARPQAKGGILLVADRGEHADAPRLIASSRRQLSDAGWHTLSIALPDSLGDLAGLSDAEQGIARQQHAEQIRQRLRQAWLALQAEGAEQITLLGQGEAAWWLLHTAGLDRDDPVLHHLVLLDPRPWPQGEPLHSLFEAWDKPVLQIHSRADADRAQRQEQQREIRRLGREGSYQQILHPLDSGLPVSPLIRRIEGWLDNQPGD